MQFTVGYQLAEEGEEPFVDIVMDFKDHIKEVYFPWLDIPTSRASLTSQRGFVDWDGQKRLEEDLLAFKKVNIGLDLILNSNCYGRYALSQYLSNSVCSVIEHLQKTLGGLDVVTTTSLTIARAIKQNFKDIDIRASINMHVGTVKGMEYLAGLFDSFYIQREFNRDFERINELKQWADEHDKRIYMLANSGCLNFCSGQIFHDNLVAHEMEIDETLNIPNFNPFICWNYYKNKKNWVSFLQGSWIRPEDIHNYESHFPVVKLATRMHANTRMVVKAYSEQKFIGNLSNLFEPGFSPVFLPYIIENSKFPEDWFERTAKCDKKCQRCSYCASILKKILKRA